MHELNLNVTKDTSSKVLFNGATASVTVNDVTAVLYSDGSVRLYDSNTFARVQWPILPVEPPAYPEEDRKNIQEDRCGLHSNVIQLVETPGSILGVRDDGSIITIYLVKQVHVKIFTIMHTVNLNCHLVNAIYSLQK